MLRLGKIEPCKCFFLLNHIFKGFLSLFSLQYFVLFFFVFSYLFLTFFLFFLLFVISFPFFPPPLFLIILSNKKETKYCRKIVVFIEKIIIIHIHLHMLIFHMAIQAILSRKLCITLAALILNFVSTVCTIEMSF